MKNKITVLNSFFLKRLRGAFLFLLTIVTLSCCKNDDDNSNLPPIQQLPVASQIGANTAGCLVNGEAFLPNNQSLQPLVCNYINGQDFALGISKEINGTLYKIYIYIGNTTLQVGQTYQLTEQLDNNSKYGSYIVLFPAPNYNTDWYNTKQTNIMGELTITHHDFNYAILSGTFWFDAKFSNTQSSGTIYSNANPNEIIEVRNGRFDMEY